MGVSNVSLVLFCLQIYFDPVETQARVEINKGLVRQAFHDADNAVLAVFEPEAVEQLVWHVAAHPRSEQWGWCHWLGRQD